MLKLVNTFARALGALSGALLAVAWAFALWVPTAGLTLVGVSVVTALLLTVLALFGAIAAVRGHPTVLVLLFLASFFPVGLFLMSVDHWLRWSGWVDLGMLASAALLWVSRRAAPAAAAGEVQ
jgi:hypothetical protein